MPFKSKAQWRQCFAAARQGERDIKQCLEYARATKSYSLLPERVRKTTRRKRTMKLKRRR